MSRHLDLKTLIITLLVATALGMLPLLMMFDEDWRTLYGGIFVATTVLALVSLSDHITMSSLTQSGKSFVLLSVPVLLSTWVNVLEDSRLPNLVVLGCYAVIGPLILHRPSKMTFPILGGISSLFLMVVVLFILWLSSDTGDLLILAQERRSAFDTESINLHPNFIGLLCVVAAIGVSGVRNKILWGVICLTALGGAWLLSSRGAILGILVAMAIPILIAVLRRDVSAVVQRRILMGGVIVLLLLGRNLFSFVSEDVLLLDDPYRGADTGFTNRTELWQAAWTLWLNNPIFGVGHGEGSDEMGYGLYAHNTVLVLLSETGLVGLIAFSVFSYLIFRHAKRLLWGDDHIAAIYLMTALAVYWVYGLFEGRGINAGNPLSALFFIISFGGLSLPVSPPTIGRETKKG